VDGVAIIGGGFDPCVGLGGAGDGLAAGAELADLDGAQLGAGDAGGGGGGDFVEDGGEGGVLGDHGVAGGFDGVVQFGGGGDDIGVVLGLLAGIDELLALIGSDGAGDGGGGNAGAR